MVQGLIAVVLTAVIALDLLTPSVSRVIAGGGAGTWFFVGYSMFILVGVLGVALTALFYFYLESILGKVYKGIAKGLAWAHLILMNVGIIAAAGLMMVAGYRGGRGQLPEGVGGLGLNPGEVHMEILAIYPVPVSIAVLVLALGIFLGGVGYALQFTKK